MIEGVKPAKTIEYNNTMNKREFKQIWMREKKELWKSKRMYEKFVREMPQIAEEKETRNWLRKADLKVETEAMLCCAKTGNSKHKIDKTNQLPPCRISEKKSETKSHTVSECEKLAQNKYKRREGNVASIVH